MRERAGRTRKLKSNAAIITSGIITFGHEAQHLFAALSPNTQDAAFLELSHAIADRLNTELTSLVVHLDETAIHAHFDLVGYNRDGIPLSQSTRPTLLSVLQDLTCDVMEKYCPGIERGHKKYDRLRNGADYADTMHRSVKQLHQDLPREIDEVEARLKVLLENEAKLTASCEKTKRHLFATEQKIAEGQALEKRLLTYQKRQRSKEVELETVRKEQIETELRLTALRKQILDQASENEENKAQNEKRAQEISQDRSKLEQQKTLQREELAERLREAEERVSDVDAKLELSKAELEQIEQQKRSAEDTRNQALNDAQAVIEKTELIKTQARQKETELSAIQGTLKLIDDGVLDLDIEQEQLGWSASGADVVKNEQMGILNTLKRANTVLDPVLKLVSRTVKKLLQRERQKLLEIIGQVRQDADQLLEIRADMGLESDDDLEEIRRRYQNNGPT